MIEARTPTTMDEAGAEKQRDYERSDIHKDSDNLEEKQVSDPLFLALLKSDIVVRMTSEKQSHQIQLAIEVLSDKTDGKIIYGSDEKFWIYDCAEGYWLSKSNRYIGNRLKEFAIKIGCYHLNMSTHQGIDSLVKQAQYDLYREVEPQKGLLNFKNGTYDTSADVFRGHRKEDFLTYVIPYDFDPNAKCPLWDRVLKEWLPDDVILILQELFGNVFLDNRHEKIGFLVGGGRNGKSVCLEAISQVLGAKNISNFSLSQITEEQGIFRASMEGKVLNISMDNSEKIKNFAIFKGLVSGEPQTMKRLYNQPYSSSNYPKTILAANALPKVEDYSDGYFRRLLIIPFERQIPSDDVDTELKEKLVVESAGILNWIIEGARRLRRQERFSDSYTINQFLDEYRRESDTVACYIDEKEWVVGTDDKISLSMAFEDFNQWIFRNGYAKMGNRTFAKRLRLLKFETEKIGGNLYLWYGGAKTAIDSQTPF